MPLYEIYSHSDRFHYRANLFSLATCFLILCTALTFLPPFLITYFAGGFWTKEGSYSEQPRVNYSKYILITEYNDKTTTNPFFSSSFALLNAAFREVLIPGTNTFSAIASNNDGVTDSFSISFQLLFNSNNVVISNINAWLIFQYELQGRENINMETMALVNLYAPNPVSLLNNYKITAAGELVFVQRQPIQSSGSDTTYNEPIINPDSLLVTSSINLSPVLAKYFTRKYYTSYQSQSLKWETGALSASPVLNVNITVNVGRQFVRFTPGFWQEFKWGWIQYLSVLLPFALIFHRTRPE